MITRRNMMVLSAGTLLAACASKFRRYNGPAVTYVVVDKSDRALYLLHHDKVLRAFPMQLGFAPRGHKQVEGDGKTPEGIYRIDRRNPNSDYHLSIGISYPNAADIRAAEALGLPPGGDIFIHGTPRRYRRRSDWTAGCIAVSNKHMEEVYAMVRDGTPIQIRP